MINYNIKINKFGDKTYYLNDILHREDGPAVESANGNKAWYKNGQCHREDGPAIERTNGDKLWYKNGKLHREDGPAIELTGGEKAWYLNDKCYGYNNDFNDDFTNESWIKFVKTLIFS